MSLKEMESPAGTFLILPSIRHARNGSVGSLSKPSQMDKETHSQALDLIHNDASQSETLTTFNEYTSPPTSSSLDGKSITSELQGGLSGLYNRLRASVGGVIQKVEGGEANEDERGEGNLSIKNPRLLTSNHTPTANQVSVSLRSHSPSVSSTILDVEAPASHLQSPPSVTVCEAQTHDLEGLDKAPKSSSAQQPGAPKSVTSSASLLKSTSSSLNQIPQPAAISPALAEVSVSAVMDSARSSTAFSNSQANNGNINPMSVKVDQETTWPTTPEVSMDQIQIIHSVADNHIDITNISQEIQPPHRTLPVVADNAARVHFARRPHEENDDLASAQLARIISPLSASDEMNPYTSRKSPVQSKIPQPYRPESNLSRASSSDDVSQSVRGTDTPSSKLHKESEIGDSHFTQPSSHSRIAELVRVDADPRALNVAMSQIKSRVLSKEYWMRDENAKDCFYCGDPFSTFRRKHHCRELLSHQICPIVLQVY